MKKMKIIFSILLSMSLLLAGKAYSAPVAEKKNNGPVFSGTVQDVFGNSLDNVVIKIPDSEKGDLSGPDGSFEIKGTFDDNTRLVFSKEGYGTLVKTVSELAKTPAVMQRDVSGSDTEVHLIKNNRSNLSVTSSAATISGEELGKTHHSHLGAALAGRLPGLIVSQSSNEPGAENYTLNVRGTSTTNGRAPLILIDGIVSSSFDYINPQDVESVTVLKDAAATALYGMQGGNGIISIVTKRGVYGKPTLSLNVDYSFQEAVRTPKMTNAVQYASLMNEAYENQGLGKYYMYSSDEIGKYESGADPELYPNNDWYDMFMKPVVQTQRVNFSAHGGGEFMKYYTSLGYMHQDSPFQTDGKPSKPFGLHRYDIRTNVDVKLNKYVRGYMNLAGRVQRNIVSNTEGGTGAIYSSLFDMAPNIYGPLTPDAKVIATPQVTNPTYGRINRDGYRKQINTHVNAILALDVDLAFITKGLSTSGQIAFYTNALSNIHGKTDYERWIRNTSVPDELVFTPYGANTDQPITLGKGVSYAYRSEFEWNLSYNRVFGDHAVRAHGFINKQYENAAALDTGILPYVTMTYGFQVGYGFKNVLFADFVAGYQGSEAFAKGHRYGFFPSGSVAWVISNHDFMKNSKVFSNLKIRGSYGMTGNDNIEGGRRYLYKDNFQTATGGYIGAWGNIINEIQFGNPLVAWEKSKIVNVGLDVGLWNQLTLSADYFKDNRSDILTNRNTVPGSSGISAEALPPANIGKITNEGFEIRLGYLKDINKDWTINLSGYFALCKNEVKNLDELVYTEDYAYKYRNTGYPVGQQWGYRIDYSNGNGYFNSQQEIDASGLSYDGQAPRPGDFIYQDLNKDHVIDVKDMAPMGYGAMPEVNWGATLNLSWKNIDLSVLFQGVARTSAFMSGCGFFESYKTGTFFEKHLNAWTQERYASGAEITAPALSLTSSSSHRSNDYYLYDKSFGRLKNLEIGYRLPLRWSNKIQCESIRVYFSGVNLFTFDNMDNKDFDAEMSGLTVFPTYRYFNVGMNIMF